MKTTRLVTRLSFLPFLALTLAVLSLTSGCTTDAFCFAGCDGSGAGGVGGISGIGGEPMFGESGGTSPFTPDGSVGGAGTCQLAEICNGKDDDCNGKIDDDIDFTNPLQCGNCDTNCYAMAINVPRDQVSCVPPADADLGTKAGTCKFGKCADDYYDVDKDPSNGCEYYCVKTSDIDKDNDKTCGKDDDCDGLIDEDLDVCGDLEHCGSCGHSCTAVNGTPKCVTTAKPGTACTRDNTHCDVEKCDPGWWAIPGGGEGCWYKCEQTNGGVEICDGIDNDCDTLIDDADPDLEVGEKANLGKPCQGGTQGECAAPEHAGIKKCISASIQCCDPTSNDVDAVAVNLPKNGIRNGICAGTTAVVLHPGERPEECNGKDDDCNGPVDDNTNGAGSPCGTSVGICNTGVLQCDAAQKKLVCAGSTPPAAVDVCNGADDDCDGIIDGTLPSGTPVKCTTDAGCASGQKCLARASASDKVCAIPPAEVGTACNLPPAAPCVNAAGQQVDCKTAGAKPVPQPYCAAGAFTCSTKLVCTGGKTSTVAQDLCGEDSNCDGRLDNQPNLLTDIANCGACGNDCRLKGAHAAWSCQAGKCVLPTTNKCQSGFIDCDGNPNDCEVACVPSGAERCNNFDDNCDCKVDNDVPVPSPAQVCGVSQGASDPGCQGGTGGIQVACTAGTWKCTFPAGYCTAGACSATPDVCDGKDNNCNGNTDENQKLPVLTSGYLGQACASDDGKAPPGDGACRGTGTYVCNGANATKCSAVRNDAAAGPELCDDIDNDCDGSVDEAFNAKGTNATYFVKPNVVQVSTNPARWMFQYEASRPSATAQNPGSGNGYWCTGAGCSGVLGTPGGTTLDKTPACSVPGKIPWFNVTPAEVEQTCQAMGGTICGTPTWTTACQAGAGCTYGYGAGNACTATAKYTATGPFCNLGPFDFDGAASAANTDGVLVTKSSALVNCYAAWGATPATTGIFDMTGNLREITKRGSNDYPLMGGAFDTEVETGATCDFDFYSITGALKLYDAGFRCCFSSDPTK